MCQFLVKKLVPSVCSGMLRPLKNSCINRFRMSSSKKEGLSEETYGAPLENIADVHQLEQESAQLFRMLKLLAVFYQGGIQTLINTYGCGEVIDQITAQSDTGSIYFSKLIDECCPNLEERKALLDEMSHAMALHSGGPVEDIVRSLGIGNVSLDRIVLGNTNIEKQRFDILRLLLEILLPTIFLKSELVIHLSKQTQGECGELKNVLDEHEGSLVNAIRVLHSQLESRGKEINNIRDSFMGWGLRSNQMDKDAEILAMLEQEG